MTTGFKFDGLNEASYWNGQYGGLPWLQSLHDAAEIGANTIAITSTSYLASKTSSTIYSNAQTESLANVAAAVDDVKAHGLTAVLKPHIDLADGFWRGRLAPSDTDAFFDNYKAWILDYAKLAAEHDVDLLVIGTELDQLAGAQYHHEWAEIVDAIREVYSGPLTYASNSDGNVAIWDLVDYIGINPYVPLADDAAGTVEDFVAAWNEVPTDRALATAFHDMAPVDYYKYLSETYDKPLIMTELGYRSLDGAAAKPMDYYTQGTVDETEQAALYEAFFQVFAPESSWMQGAMIWGWSTDRAAQEVRTGWASGYSIEGKEAEAVVSDWYDGGGFETEPGAPTEVTFRMAANIAGGPATAVIVVDRQIVASFQVNNTTEAGFKDYSLMVNLEPGAQHKVEVHFTNPANGRGLHVDYVAIGDERFQAETPGASKTFVTSYSKSTIVKVDVATPEAEQPPEPVNHAPVAPALATLTVVEDQASEAKSVGATDKDDDALSFALKDGGAPAKGVVTFADGKFVYTPNADATGADSFVIVVSDGKGGVTEQTVSVTITPHNDAPVADTADEATRTESGQAVSGALLAGSDADAGDELHFKPGSIEPVGGTVTIDALTGAYVFTPSANFAGTAHFTYKVSDGDSDSAEKTVIVEVTAANQAASGSPVLSDTSPTRGQAIGISALDIADPDGAPSDFTIVWQSSADGVNWSTIEDATASTFIPGPAEVGRSLRAVVSFTDGGGTLERVVSEPTSPVGDARTGSSRNDVLNGTEGADMIAGQGGHDSLNGSDGDDQVSGGEGNDSLNGGVGADRMEGGAGDDSYIVDDAGDIVVEFRSQGSDRVTSSVDFTLGAEIEGLTLTGAALAAGGNASNNTITGNALDNLIDGGAGQDTMKGLGGNDTYVVDNTRDLVTESSGGGTDTVRASISYRASNYIENIELTGNATASATGNDLDNRLIGNAAANTLNGGGGRDVMIGGGGSDTGLGGSGNDTFVEAAGSGKDSYDGGSDTDTIDFSGVLTGVQVNLSAGTANGAETGSDRLTSIENVIGGGGDDTITAASSRNVLAGGEGDDLFVFASTSAAGTGSARDVILDFEQGHDRIDLSGMDAHTGSSGNQAFESVRAGTSFNDEQQITVFQTTIGGAVHTIVQGNVNSGSGADFQIDLVGAYDLTAADFIL